MAEIAGFSFPFPQRAPEEAAMKKLIFVPLVIAVAAARGQTVSQSQIRHVATSLNHLTVFEYGEPVTNVAIADPDSFRVERRDDKVLVMPLREGIATNFFVWTPTRELSYELDPAGDVKKMEVLIRTDPEPKPLSVASAAAQPTDTEIRKIASLVLTQAMMGVEDVTHDPRRPAAGQVQVDLDQVYRAKDQLYIRYSITNQTKMPFRVTTPDISAPTPTQQPISLLSLRNHQISSQTFGSFKTKPVSSLDVTQAEVASPDLAPGQSTTGVISIKSSPANAPQIYELNFGAEGGKPLTVAVVL